MAADLVDLALEVVDDLGGYLVSQDLVEVDPLVTGDRFVGRQLDTFLHLDRWNTKDKSRFSSVSLVLWEVNKKALELSN